MEQETNDSNVLVGKLRSDIQIELHTISAIQIWRGRDQTDDKSRIFSMTRAISHLRQIELATKLDDPYADLRLTGVYEQIAEIKKLIGVEHKSISEILKSVPVGFTVRQAASINPISQNIFINIPSGYQLVFLLCEFDLLVRDIQLAKHISLISGNNASNRQDIIAHKFRSLINFTTKFQRTNLTRKDIQENSEKTAELVKKYGQLPDFILNADKDRDRTVGINE